MSVNFNTRIHHCLGKNTVGCLKWTVSQLPFDELIVFVLMCETVEKDSTWLYSNFVVYVYVNDVDRGNFKCFLGKSVNDMFWQPIFNSTFHCYYFARLHTINFVRWYSIFIIKNNFYIAHIYTLIFYINSTCIYLII